MTVDLSMITFATVITIGSFILKLYHDHITIADLKEEKSSKNKRIKTLEDHILKIIEALERTYPTSEYLYHNFYDKDDIDVKLAHIKELFVELKNKVETAS